MGKKQAKMNSQRISSFLKSYEANKKSLDSWLQYHANITSSQLVLPILFIPWLGWEIAATIKEMDIENPVSAFLAAVNSGIPFQQLLYLFLKILLFQHTVVFSMLARWITIYDFYTPDWVKLAIIPVGLIIFVFEIVIKEKSKVKKIFFCN